MSNNYDDAPRAIRHRRGMLTSAPILPAPDRREVPRIGSHGGHTFNPWGGLTLRFPDTAHPARLPGIDLLETRDAAHECTHGRLPGDRSAPCGCWEQAA